MESLKMILKTVTGRHVPTKYSSTIMITLMMMMSAKFLIYPATWEPQTHTAPLSVTSSITVFIQTLGKISWSENSVHQFYTDLVITGIHCTVTSDVLSLSNLCLEDQNCLFIINILSMIVLSGIINCGNIIKEKNIRKFYIYIDLKAVCLVFWLSDQM